MTSLSSLPAANLHTSTIPPTGTPRNPTAGASSRQFIHYPNLLREAEAPRHCEPNPPSPPRLPIRWTSSAPRCFTKHGALSHTCVETEKKGTGPLQRGLPCTPVRNAARPSSVPIARLPTRQAVFAPAITQEPTPIHNSANSAHGTAPFQTVEENKYLNIPTIYPRCDRRHCPFFLSFNEGNSAVRK